MRAFLFSLLVSLVVGEEDASLLQTASVRHNILTLINGLQRNPSIEIKKYVSDAPAAEALIQRAVERSTSQTVAATFMALPREDQERLIEFGRTSPEAHEVFAKLSPEARQAALLVVERHLDSAMLEKGTTNKAVKGKKARQQQAVKDKKNGCNIAQAEQLVEYLDFGIGFTDAQGNSIGGIMALFDVQGNFSRLPDSINGSQCEQAKTNAEFLKGNPCYSLSFQALPYTHNGTRMKDICFEASKKMVGKIWPDQPGVFLWRICSAEIALVVWDSYAKPFSGDNHENCSSDTWDLKNFTGQPREMFAILPPKMSACKDGWADVTTYEACKKAAGFLTFRPDDDSNVTIWNATISDPYNHVDPNVSPIKYSRVKPIEHSERPAGCYFWNKKAKVYWNNIPKGKSKSKEGRQPICSRSGESLSIFDKNNITTFQGGRKAPQFEPY